MAQLSLLTLIVSVPSLLNVSGCPNTLATGQASIDQVQPSGSISILQPAEGRGTSQGKVFEGKQIVEIKRDQTQHRIQRASWEPKNGRQSDGSGKLNYGNRSAKQKAGP